MSLGTISNNRQGMHRHFLTYLVRNGQDMWIDGEKTSCASILRGPFLGGESPQTTMLSLEGRIAFYPEHLHRLEEAFYFFDSEGDWGELKRGLEEGLRCHLPRTGRHRVRVMIFRDHSLLWHYGLDITAEEEVFENALKACWARSLRGVPMIPPTIKLGLYCEAEGEKREAAKRGFEDVIFLNHRHQVLEGSRSNVFFRLEETFVTPLKQRGMLAGITRDKVMNILRARNIPVEERLIDAREAERAREIWLTASISGIRRVSQFNDRQLKLDGQEWRFVVEDFRRKCREEAVSP